MTGTAGPRLDDISAGDVVVLDACFTCAGPGPAIIHEDAAGLFFRCAHGRHYLDSELDEDGRLVGIALPETAGMTGDTRRRQHLVDPPRQTPGRAEFPPGAPNPGAGSLSDPGSDPEQAFPDGDPLAPARGCALGVLGGATIWVLLLWLIFGG